MVSREVDVGLPAVPTSAGTTESAERSLVPVVLQLVASSAAKIRVAMGRVFGIDLTFMSPPGVVVCRARLEKFVDTEKNLWELSAQLPEVSGKGSVRAGKIRWAGS